MSLAFTFIACILSFIIGYSFRIVREVQARRDVNVIEKIEIRNEIESINTKPEQLNESIPEVKEEELLIPEEDYEEEPVKLLPPLTRKKKIGVIILLVCLFLLSIVLGIMIGCQVQYGKIIM